MNSTKNKILSPFLASRTRVLIGGLVFVLLALFLWGVAAIPFYFESSSLVYKFGADRILLRSGKVFGLIAFCLVLFQAGSGARLKVLDRIFSLHQVFRFHRISGLCIVFLAKAHPILILASTGDNRKATLVWSNKTRDHIFLQYEFEKFGLPLKNLRIIRRFTREDVWENHSKRTFCFLKAQGVSPCKSWRLFSS